jgi:hypothetical protein
MSTKFAKAAAMDLATNIWLRAAALQYEAQNVHEGEAEDLDEVMGRVVGLILTCEEVIAYARAELLRVMEETGAPNVRTEHHTASISHPRRVVLKGPAPPKYMKEVEDRKAIGEDLDRFGSLPFAEWSNGAPFVQIRKVVKG